LKALKLLWDSIVDWFTPEDDFFDHPHDSWGELDEIGFINKQEDL
jgi:hypothetical protein